MPTMLEVEVIYPESDGQPMADNTEQFDWIVILKLGLELVFADNPNVFIAGDLLWYPVEGDNKTSVAPDVMVAFGRPKGRRGSYLQWKENNIPPQVVFEILSPCNTRAEMIRKLSFYERFGVEEYYLIDPDRQDATGWLRFDDGLTPIKNMHGWTSPRLGIQFEIEDGQIRVLDPKGNPFADYVDLAKRADAVALLAEAERNRAERERERAEKFAAKLRELGLDPENVS